MQVYFEINIYDPDKRPQEVVQISFYFYFITILLLSQFVTGRNVRYYTLPSGTSQSSETLPLSLPTNVSLVVHNGINDPVHLQVVFL